jgi:hypothetical protein
MSDGAGDDDSGIDVGVSDRQRLVRHLAKRTAVVVVVLGLWYVTRPLWHGFVYSMLFSPSAAVLLGGSLLTALALWYYPPWRIEADGNGGQSASVVDGGDDSGEFPFEVTPGELFGASGSRGRKLQRFTSVVAVLFVLSILVGIPAGPLEQRTLAGQTMADAAEVAEFPDANPENPRVVPRQVSDVATSGSVSYRQHRLGASDIARTENGSLAWSYAIEPDGFRNRVVENQRGVLVADMTRLDERPVEVYDEEFTYGQGMFLYRSADWRLKSTDYLAEYNDEPVEFSHDGQPYMYYPKTGHEWHLAPFPHTTPTWKGGALVHTNGTVEHLSPEEARSHPVLEGQRLYPLTLASAEMESLSYRNGIINQLPVVGAHEGEVEVAGLPDSAENSQPFVIDLEGERMSYVTALEPYGSDTRGLDEVWFVDAETGKYTYFATGREQLTGPERAMGVARASDSRTNWGENFVVAEPVPITVDGELWWQIKVVPVDATDVARNVFVNANDSATVELRTDDAVRSFVAGEQVPGQSAPPRNGTDGSGGDGAGDGQGDVLYYVVVTDEEGNVVERIPVRRGQDTRIVDPSGSENATAGG